MLSCKIVQGRPSTKFLVSVIRNFSGVTDSTIVKREGEPVQYPDRITHTGQAYEATDYRLARFTYAPKHVNPNFAIDLIAKVAPKKCEERVVFCDGGGGPLGHPKVYINLDKPGNHACGYCGLRFFNAHVPHSDEHHIQV